MRSHRDSVIVWAIAIVVAIALVVAVIVIRTPRADAHRVVSGGWAQRSANYYVRSHYCGGPVYWTCGRVWVPVARCGYHSYCWHGVSHSEKFLWATRLRSSSGTVNGHTGKVTGFGEY